ncbi:MAG: hypothetical protein ACHP6I_03505 [Rickettsiales bacterium]
MFTLLYILVFIIFIPTIYLLYVEVEFLSDLKRREKLYNKMAIFTIGKRLTAFTIEKTEYVEANVAMSMGSIRRFLFWVLRLVYKTNVHRKVLMDLARRELVVRIKKAAQGSDYVVNLHVDNFCLSKGIVILHAYGTSVKLHQDTLSLYHIPEELPPLSRYTNIATLLYQFIYPMFVIIAILASIYATHELYRIEALSAINSHYENVLWNYMKTSSYIEDRNLKPHLLETENSMRQVLKSLPTGDLLVGYDPELYLEDDTTELAYILPTAKIITTKGVVNEMDSENEVAFFLAYMLGHLKNQEHIKNLNEELVDQYLLIKAFGEDSFIAKLGVRLTPFYYVTFNEQQELDAIKFALDVVNQKYGGIGLRDEYIDLFINTEFGKARKVNVDKLRTLLSQYSESKPVPISYIVDEPIVTKQPLYFGKIFASNDELDELFKDFNTQYTDGLNKYLKAANFIPNLMNPANLVTKDQVVYGNQMLKYGNDLLDYYEPYLDGIVNEFSVKIAADIAKINDSDRQKILKANWERQMSYSTNIASSYFARDRLVLQSLGGLMSFLNKRVGKYSLQGGTLVFLYSNDQQNYDVLINRAINQYNGPLPTN